jgi:hypothetical protein
MASEFLVGAASADITPSEPVALDGQFELRVSQKVDTPITANVVALESREGDRSLDAAVMVSCPSQEVEGLSTLNADFWHPVRKSFAQALWPGFVLAGLGGRSRRSIATPKGGQMLVEETVKCINGLWP